MKRRKSKKKPLKLIPLVTRFENFEGLYEDLPEGATFAVFITESGYVFDPNREHPEACAWYQKGGRWWKLIPGRGF